MTPIERNGRKLIGVLALFPAGATSEDLRRAFEKETSLVRQSYYDALRFIKSQGWIIGGGRDQLYCLSPDKSWKVEPITSVGESIGVSRDKDQLEYLLNSQAQRIEQLQSENERLLDWSNGGDAGVALPSLVRIVGDGAASTRQRLKAASAILAFQVQDDGVVEFTKRYLESVCTSTDIGNIDHKVAAAELLRRCESPRIAPETVRPSYSEDGGTEAQRTEAWRTYERWQLKKQIVLETREPPKPGWDVHLKASTYQPPEGNSWPPVRVVTDPTSGFRLLDNLLPKTAYRIGSGDIDDK